VLQYLLSHAGHLLSGADGRCFVTPEQVAALATEALYPVAEGIGLAVVAEPPADFAVPLELRAQLAQADQGGYELFARGAQLAVWHDQHRFCGRCGTPLRHHDADLAKQCPACGLTLYPRISPCIIVLVVKGEQALLAHNARFAGRWFSTLAGFVESGESVERAVAREVQEEVGIEIANVRYFRSQPWPFPHSLMLGFFADYAAGELTPDGVEIDEAGWFSRDALPDLPPPFSISRQLIEAWMAGPV